jgi:hypothetical protein
MRCEDLRPDYLLYAMGTMEEPDLSEMRAHLERACPMCTAGLAEAREIAFGLGAGVDGPAPPARLRRRVLAVAQPERPARMRFWQIRVPAWQAFAATAACGAIVLLAAGMWVRGVTGRDGEMAARMARLEASEKSLRALSPEFGAAPVFALELERGGVWGETVKRIPAATGGQEIILAMPVDLVRQSDRVELRNAEERILLSVKPVAPDGVDSASIMVPSKLLTPGRYRVVLFSDRRPVAHLGFEVR